MKKYLLMMLAAVLFAACSDDNNDDGSGQKSPLAKVDYAKMLGANLQTVKKTFGTGENLTDMGSMLLYDFTGKTKLDNVQTLGFMFNEKTDAVYMISEMLTGVKKADMEAYLAKTYKKVVDDGETYYANNTDLEKATKVISVTEYEEAEGLYVYYVDPTNVPEQSTEAIYVADFTTLIGMMGMSQEDVEDMYGDVFQEGWAAVTDDQELCSAIMVSYDANGKVESIFLMLEDGSSDDIISVFETAGYTTQKTSEEPDEDGYYSYTFTKGNIVVNYTGGNATVTYAK